MALTLLIVLAMENEVRQLYLFAVLVMFLMIGALIKMANDRIDVLEDRVDSIEKIETAK